MNILFILTIISFMFGSINCMSNDERIRLRNEIREMFQHSYDSYMNYAYPADELMPLSCKGRYRGVELSRGDVDDSMGNFSLTLIDTLDTLAIMGNYSEFEKAIALVINDVTFDSDIVVSVFETNIRVLGGLLSAHVLTKYLQRKYGLIDWYDDQLLLMSKDIGYRLLLAFNSSTGIPYPRVNLKYGLNSMKIGSMIKETCTACAGSMILEFAALSRLTDEPIFEIKARKAMDYIWQQRHRQTDLVGNIINIDTGDWIRKESGVGAGIDSYYEYCLKTYILLGDEKYLYRFNRHYTSIMKYINNNGPYLLDVHMHRPYNQAKNFMDSLLAFWPGLQVLKGDLKPAIEIHEYLYQIIRKHSFLPEAWITQDSNIHWPHYPLRPEFIESTYFLYEATKDDYYLHVGAMVMKNLQNFTRCDCGYAAMNDVRTKKKEDRMDSFFLAETLKYLFLLFSDKNEIEFNLDDYVFTTEAHLLPLSLADVNVYQNKSFILNSYKSLSKISRKNFLFNFDENFDQNDHEYYNCPTTKESIRKLNQDLDNLSYFNLIRLNVREFLTNNGNVKYSKKLYNTQPRIRASQFSATKRDHIDLVKQLGINVIVMKDGRIKLIHNSAMAQSIEAAEEGAYFMQEMITLSQQQRNYEQRLRTVSFTILSSKIKISLLAGPAQFGHDFDTDPNYIEGKVVKLDPFDGCNIVNDEDLIEDDDDDDDDDDDSMKSKLKNKIALIERGNCMFIEKARNVEKFGAIGMIVVDNVENSSSKNLPMFSMSGDGVDDVRLHSVFLYSVDAKILLNAMDENPDLIVRLDVHHHDEEIVSTNEQNEKSTINNNENYNVKDLIKNLLFKTTNINKLKTFDSIISMVINDEQQSKILSLLKNIQLLPVKSTTTTTIEPQPQQPPNHHCWNPLLNRIYFIDFIHKNYLQLCHPFYL